MAKVNIEVRAEDRDRIRELAYHSRRPGLRPLTLGETVALLLDRFEQATATIAQLAGKGIDWDEANSEAIHTILPVGLWPIVPVSRPSALVLPGLTHEQAMQGSTELRPAPKKDE